MLPTFCPYWARTLPLIRLSSLFLGPLVLACTPASLNSVGAGLCLHQGLSHHNLVLNLSGPIVAMAAFTFAVFTESSDVGYPIRLIKVPLGTSGLLGCPYGLGGSAGNPDRLKLANASGKFKNEAIQYCVFILSYSLPGVNGCAATYASLAAAEIAEPASKVAS